MRCWACSRAIKLPDLVTELPIVGAIVHIGCYERETSQSPLRAITLGEALLSATVNRDAQARESMAGHNAYQARDVAQESTR